MHCLSFRYVIRLYQISFPLLYKVNVLVFTNDNIDDNEGLPERVSKLTVSVCPNIVVNCWPSYIPAVKNVPGKI